MKPYIAPILLSMLFALPVYAETASPESVRLLLNKTGAGDKSIQVMEQMLPALKKVIPDAPEKFWRDIMASASPDDFVEMMIPIYQQHLSQQEIDAINAFYDTPAGKKLATSMPTIQHESTAAGMAWGENVASEVIKRYEAQQQYSSREADN